MNTTHFLSLGQAALATGKSKPTISRYIKNGTLSIISKDQKGYKIDPAELFRVFTPTGDKMLQTVTDNITPVTPVKNNDTIRLEAELEAARKEIASLKADKEDYKIRLDRESEERRKLTMMISDMREKSTEKAVERHKSFFGMFSRKNG